MRIIFFTAMYFPFRGGYCESIQGLIKKLSEEGHELTMVTCKIPPNTMDMEITDYGLKIIRICCWNPRWLNGTFPIPSPLKFFQLYLRLRHQPFDVVSTQTRFFPTSWYGLLFAKLRSLPSIHTERGGSHSISSKSFITFFGKIVDHTFGWVLCHFSQKIVGVSQGSCRFLRHLGAKNPICIFNGIDSQKWDGVTFNDSKECPFTITFVGRLVFGKGVQTLLEAFAKIKRENSVRLFIVGDGEYRSELEALSKKLDLQEEIEFIGERDQKGILELFRKTHVFVNPSYSEGLPRSVLEAAATGLPIIATNVGGTNEIIEHQKTGFLIPGKDKTALVEALQLFLRSPNLRKMYGETAKKYVREHFEWKIIAKQYTQLFQEVTTEKK